MLLFVSIHGHSFPVHALRNRRLGIDLPVCECISYDVLLRSATTRNAVHIFTGLDQLYDWELVNAADLFRALKAAGLKCLNDPARVMGRYELLANLHHAGINPFAVYRADSLPRPQRFPVFLRREFDHKGPISDLIPDQDILDRRLADLRSQGYPLRGVLVTEYAAEPIADGLWRKYGAFRIGGAFHFHGHVIEDRWIAKFGNPVGTTEQMYEDEEKLINDNRVPDAVRTAFDISGIEWGRADFALYRGKNVIYEINTNPWIYRARKFPSPTRQRSMITGRHRFARLLFEIDEGDGSTVDFQPSNRLKNYASMYAQFGSAVRP